MVSFPVTYRYRVIILLNFYFLLFIFIFLFLQWELICKDSHQGSHNSREDREECPYHCLYRFLVGDSHDCLACGLICCRNKSCHTEKHSDERTRDCTTELLSHCAGREDKTCGRLTELLCRKVSHIGIHRPKQWRLETSTY